MVTEPSGDVLGGISAEHVPALAAGATLLGSGGGGDVALAERLLRQVLREHPVRVCRASELDPQARVVHVAIVGAPDVFAERLIAPRDLAAAVLAVVGQLGGDLAAVGVLEVGGVNCLTAVLTASHLGVPVIDGDLMGRAFPSINNSTMALAGHGAAPMALVSPAGDTVVIPNCSARMADALAVSCSAAMGGAASMAVYPTTAGVLEATGVRRSLSSCIALGQAFLSAPRGDMATLGARLGGDLLFEGRVDEIRPRQDQEPGSVTLVSQVSGSTARVDQLEEFLAVTVDGVTLAATPGVIAALEPVNRTALRTDQVRLGQTLAIVALPTLHLWPPGADSVVGPAAFGLELEPVLL